MTEDLPEFAPPGRCKNCGAQLHGEFCGACGQRAGERLTLATMSGQAVNNVLSVEAPFWRTVRGVLLRPGAMAAEYVAGRRVRFTQPFRFAVIGGLVAFALQGLLFGSREIPPGPSPEFYGAQIHSVKVWVSDKIELLMLATMPVLAVFLRAVFPGRNLAEHLAFVYFVLGGVYVVQTLMMPIIYLFHVVALAVGFVPLIWFGWAAIAFNQTGWVSGLVRSVLMVVAYFVCLELGQHLVALGMALLQR